MTVLAAGDGLESWARTHGVEVLLPPAFPVEPEHDPRGDFGRLARGAPTHVFRPADVAGLAQTLRFLAERRLPYRLRGGAWSSGGQVVPVGGAVVDLTRLARVVEDRPAENEITVEGGATWLTVAAHLRETGRRPLILPENLRLTVGGSLAVGDLGDTSVVHGPTISQVKRLTLVAPDGAVRRLGPSDELFRYVLGGSGLVGAIAEATLATVRRPSTAASRMLAWVTIDGFCADIATIANCRLYELFSGALAWFQGAPTLYGIAGNFAEAIAPGEPGLWDIVPSLVGGAELHDRTKNLSPPPVAWDLYRPAIQVAVPMELAPEVLRRLADFIRAAPELHDNLPSIGLLIFKPDLRFPLAPQPEAPLALVLLVRPQVQDRALAERLLPFLREIGARALDLGGRVTLSSVATGLPDFPQRQLGSALDDLRRLKSAVDPLWLCNRGVIEGLENP